jgi:hypothetical protein
MLRLFARQDCHVRGRLPDGKLLLVRSFPGPQPG